MRRWTIALLVGILTGCGTTTVVTTTETVTTSAPATATTLQPADPTLPATCQPEPNSAPSCTQGGGVPVAPVSAGDPCAFGSWQVGNGPDELDCKSKSG